jgi:hypothetical protein
MPFHAPSNSTDTCGADDNAVAMAMDVSHMRPPVDRTASAAVAESYGFHRRMNRFRGTVAAPAVEISCEADSDVLSHSARAATCTAPSTP